MTDDSDPEWAGAAKLLAGGEPGETRTASPIREVENVASAVAGMAARLA
jgi:hypothetical protein